MSSKFVIDNWKNDAFLPFFSCIFANFSSHFHLLCDTCDSKKTKSLLEGVRACAYTRTREKTFIPNRTSKRPIKRIWLFCYVCISYFVCRKKKNALFSDFFPLWGDISPYTYRGVRNKYPAQFLFQFTFTAKAINHIFSYAYSDISTLFPAARICPVPGSK